VPLLTAIPNFLPTCAENCSSNFLTNGPSEEIQAVSMHSARYFFSLPSIRDSFTEITVFYL